MSVAAAASSFAQGLESLFACTPAMPFDKTAIRDVYRPQRHSPKRQFVMCIVYGSVQHLDTLISKRMPCRSEIARELC
jgi:hypothetical protein